MNDAKLPLADTEKCQKCGGYACECAPLLTPEELEGVQVHEALRGAFEESPGIVISYEAMRAALRAALSVEPT